LCLVGEEKRYLIQDVDVLKRAISAAWELGITTNIIEAGSWQALWLEYCSELTTQINSVKIYLQ
jgi:hypothetical protein